MPRTASRDSFDAAKEVIRPPIDLPPAKRGSPSESAEAAAIADRTVFRRMG